ncbi:MAG: hypothetical protein JJ894_03265 [Dinoroseobacter sp.]|nr:hypothetical protein [Dinoroseobacter sp.]
MNHDKLDIAEKLQRAAHIEKPGLAPSDVKAFGLSCADCAEAAREIRTLRNALADQGKPYVGDDSVAVVLYFADQTGAEEFTKAVRAAKPSLVEKAVPVASQ